MGAGDVVRICYVQCRCMSSSMITNPKETSGNSNRQLMVMFPNIYNRYIGLYSPSTQYQEYIKF